MATAPESSAARTANIPAVVENALDTVRAGFSRVDAERADAYGLLGVFRSARHKQLARHEQLLALKLGKDAPRVLATRNQRGDLKTQLRDLKTAQAAASAQPPDPGTGGYVVHGFVRNAEREPTIGATVALYDEKGRRHADFEPVETDANGYFLLHAARLGGTTFIAGIAAPTEQAKETQLQVRVFNARRFPFQTTLPTLTATPGSVDFVQIVVGEPSAASPPPDRVAPSPAQPPRTSASDNVSPKLKTLATELRRKTPPTKTAAIPSTPKATPRSAERAKRKR